MTLEKSITWKLTRRCNFQCRYCFSPREYGTGERPAGERFSPAHISGCFDKTRYSWRITLTGGEPFLYPDFITLCTLLTHKHSISIHTNLSTDNVVFFANTINPAKVLTINASLHVEEREKRSRYADFIKAVNYLQKKEFNVRVLYVLYPPLFKRVASDLNDLKRFGIVTDLILFRGHHDGKCYPEAYGDREREYISENVTDKRQRMVLESKIKRFGYRCASGRDFLSMTEDGDVKRCNTSKRILFNMFYDDISFNVRDEPCPFLTCRCPYEGIDWAGTTRGRATEIMNNMLRELPLYYTQKLTLAKFKNYFQNRFCCFSHFDIWGVFLAPQKLRPQSDDRSVSNRSVSKLT